MRDLYLICYDITNNRKRAKISHMLEKYGQRVNLSVFECLLSKPALMVVREQLSKLVKKNIDSVKIYYICKECYSKSISLGDKKYEKSKSTLFI
ncbi:MAG: CRISPR-associated endonuclease Cas2 [Deltaproteobacteria bacterium]